MSQNNCKNLFCLPWFFSPAFLSVFLFARANRFDARHREARLAAWLMGVFLAAAWLPAAQAQTEVAAIPILGAGAQTGQAIVNPITNQIYILGGAAGGNDAITQIDGATHASSPIALPAIGGNNYGPFVLNPVNNRLYVVNYQDSQVIVVDLANNNMTTTIQFPMVARPIRLAVNPVTGKVYVIHETGVVFVGNISVIDSNNNPTFNLLPMGGGNLFDIAINPVSNKIYVADQSTASVIVIDGQNDIVVNQITMLNSPVNVSVNPVTNLVYVVERDGSSQQALDNAAVRIIDGTNDTLTPTIVSLPSAWRLTINPATNKIYVAASSYNNSGLIRVIDAANNHTLTTIAFIPGLEPNVIALNPATNQLYVFEGGSNTVMVIDGQTDTPIATRMFGQDLRSAAVNPITNKIYFSDNAGPPVVRVIDGHTYNPGPADSIGVGSNPTAVAVDPVTNRIYVANQNSGDVSVIDAVTGMPIMDPATGMNPVAGLTPFDVAVNPITNLAYVTNANNGNVSVIDSAANKIADITVQGFPHGVAVNPATNRIYVANSGTGTVSVIDGASNINIANVPVGLAPNELAINPSTNRIYVTSSSNSIWVIDGATNTAAPVNVGGNSFSGGIAVNPSLNLTYVVTDQNGGSIVVIDGNNMASAPIGVMGASTIAVNPSTNRIYVAAQNVGGVSVIDGMNNTVIAMIPIGQNLQSIIVDQAANLIYVSAQMSGWVSVIDGATHTKLGDFLPNNGGFPRALALNPVTGRVYATNSNNNSVTVYDGLRETPLPLTTTASLASGGNVTTVNIPTFNFATTSNYAPNAPAVRTVFFQLDSLQGPWQQANGMAPNFNVMLPVPLGQHVLYAFAVDAMEGGASFDPPPFERSNILVGQLTAFSFTVAQPVAPVFTSAVPADITVLVNTPIISPPAFTAGGAPTPDITATGLPPGIVMDPVTHIISGTPMMTGQFMVTVTAANGVMPDAVQMFTITVNALPVFTSMPPPMTINVLQGVAIPNLTFSANGFPAPTLSTMSMLPMGVTFDPATGLLSGTPMVMGMFPITITAMNMAGTATQNFTLNVAPPVTAFTGPSIPGPGNITASFTPNGNCNFTTSQFIGPPPVIASTGPVPAPPLPLDFPHGLFDFRIDNCPIVAGGTTVNFTITYPSALPAGTQYWKYGPTPMNPMPHWYVLPATISGVTATFSITDGGLGDDDLMANGTIIDQGGPGSLITAPVPTLSEWMLMLLGLLVMGSGVWLARRRGVFAPV